MFREPGTRRSSSDYRRTDTLSCCGLGTPSGRSRRPNFDHHVDLPPAALRGRRGRRRASTAFDGYRQPGQQRATDDAPHRHHQTSATKSSRYLHSTQLTPHQQQIQKYLSHTSNRSVHFPLFATTYATTVNLYHSLPHSTSYPQEQVQLQALLQSYRKHTHILSTLTLMYSGSQKDA